MDNHGMPMLTSRRAKKLIYNYTCKGYAYRYGAVSAIAWVCLCAGIFSIVLGREALLDVIDVLDSPIAMIVSVVVLAVCVAVKTTGDSYTDQLPRFDDAID